MSKLAFRLPLIVLAASDLAACNLIPKDKDPVEEAPPGTAVVLPDEAIDVPKDELGQPIDKGDGPVLQSLGSLVGVDLGERKGGCTFQHADGRSLLMTSAAADKDVVAKGVVRNKGVIVILDSKDKVGLEGIFAGPTLTNGEVTVQVKTEGGPGTKDGPVTTWSANLGAIDASGKQRIYTPGRWVCA